MTIGGADAQRSRAGQIHQECLMESWLIDHWAEERFHLLGQVKPTVNVCRNSLDD
jgi:hypothetical protein